MKPVANYPVLSLLSARSSLLASAVAMAMIPAAHAEDLLGDALAKGKTNLELRYRLENVEQPATAAVPNTANASTLRTRVRYTSGEFAQASLMLEFDNVSRLGPDRYNDTRNGHASFPIVVDPDGTDLNQALIKYMGVANTPITVGRQRVNLDNQRWVGSVGWRQNEQTLDGITLEYKGIDRFTATYGFINRINRISGPDITPTTPLVLANSAEVDTETHLVNFKYVASAAFSATAYAYLLDFDKFAAASTQTIGLRANGSIAVGETAKLGYTLEAAQQSEYAKNAGSFSAPYTFGEVTFGTPAVEGQLGYEVLGEDSGAAVQTPLATLHKFQGWADKFLATPATGLIDTYVGVSGKAAGIGYALAYHTYDADTTGATYGDEVNAQVMKTFAKRYTVTLKYADYAADSALTTDATKIWLMGEAKF